MVRPPHRNDREAMLAGATDLAIFAFIVAACFATAAVGTAFLLGIDLIAGLFG